MILRALLLILTIGISGCAGKNAGEFTFLRPSAKQIEEATRRAVCGSFKTVHYSGAKDTPETVAQVRENNAALASYDCPK